MVGFPIDGHISQPVDRCYLECDDYRPQMVQNLSEAWSRAQKNINKAQKQHKKQYDRRIRMPTFQTGD